MKVLIACEESQEVCKAFRARGFDAFSNDIIDCSGGHPEWHLKMDALEAIELEKWDLIIAHPPCTYLSAAGAARLYGGGSINTDRFQKGMEAKTFFMSLYNADCRHMALENPTPLKIFGLPRYDQAIQPFQFGEPYRKRTCLWLRGLPQLEPTNIILDGIRSWVDGGGSNRENRGLKRNQRERERERERSKTFPGIARAMAEQWGDYIMQKL